MLALSDESVKDVDGFLRKEAYTVRTASGSRSKAAYGVTGIPKSFLVGPDGKIIWKGHPRELTRAKVAEALTSARKPGERDFLVVEPSTGARMHDSLNSAVLAAEEGRLGDALDAARAVANSEAENTTARAAASALVRDLDKHLELLNRQVEQAVVARDPLAAVRLLEGLAAVLGEREGGKAAATRLTALRADEAWAGELAGAQALDAATQASIGEGKAATKRAYTEVAGAHPGTRAAERARRWAKHK